MKYNKILKIFEKTIVNLIIVILSIIAILIIWGFVQLDVQKKEYLNLFGYSIFSTETGSMYPTIKIGDLVIIKIGDEIKEEDIITYKKDNVFITHRIEQINDNYLITKGDNNNTNDEPIDKDNVIGKVVFIIDNVEVWKNVFTDINVLIPVCITVILFVILISYKEKNVVCEDKTISNEKKTGDNND